jgi:integrase
VEDGAAWRIHHAQFKPSRHPRLSARLEQGPSRRAETPAPAEKRLGHSGAPRDRAPRQGPCAVNLAIDSKLRGCDLVKLKVSDVFSAGQVKERASIIQTKTRHPVRFEITEGTRRSIAAWLDDPAMIGSEYLWPGRFHERLHISTRQYARLVRDWVSSIGLEPSSYGTHSMRRTKVAQIYRKTGNLRAVQLLLGHTKMDSTVRYLGVELEDALAISEAVEI